MDSALFWQVFLETGAPEAYLLYNKARRTEAVHVYDDQRACTESNSLQ